MKPTPPVDLQEPLDQLVRPPTRFDHDLSFPPPETIRVYDDTLRDGEQMPGAAFSPPAKTRASAIPFRPSRPSSAPTYK